MKFGSNEETLNEGSLIDNDSEEYENIYEDAAIDFDYEATPTIDRMQQSMNVLKAIRNTNSPYYPTNRKILSNDRDDTTHNNNNKNNDKQNQQEETNTLWTALQIMYLDVREGVEKAVVELLLEKGHLHLPWNNQEKKLLGKREAYCA